MFLRVTSLVDRNATGRANRPTKMSAANELHRPQFSIRRFRAGAQSDNPTFLKQRERIIQAMQKAGIPEG